MKTILVQRGDLLPADLWAGEVLLDPLGASHARYGAEGECLYLIRPDGFVGFRCQPPRWKDLEAYLSRVFLLPS
jgi:hypothetical protein